MTFIGSFREAGLRTNLAIKGRRFMVVTDGGGQAFQVRGGQADPKLDPVLAEALKKMKGWAIGETEDRPEAIHVAAILPGYDPHSDPNNPIYEAPKTGAELHREQLMEALAMQHGTPKQREAAREARRRAKKAARLEGREYVDGEEFAFPPAEDADEEDAEEVATAIVRAPGIDLVAELAALRADNARLIGDLTFQASRADVLAAELEESHAMIRALLHPPEERPNPGMVTTVLATTPAPTADEVLPGSNNLSKEERATQARDARKRKGLETPEDAPKGALDGIVITG